MEGPGAAGRNGSYLLPPKMRYFAPDTTSATTTPRRSTRTSPASAAALTDDEGRYRFLTIKPGAYPWGNHPNAWRPQHIHLSLFGEHFASRLVTQMYFPGDPLHQYDPMITGTPDEGAQTA